MTGAGGRATDPNVAALFCREEVAGALEAAHGQFRAAPGEPISFGWFRSFFSLIGEVVADKYHVRRTHSTAAASPRHGGGVGGGSGGDSVSGGSGDGEAAAEGEALAQSSVPGAAGHHGALLRKGRRARLGALLRPTAEVEASACARLCARIALAS